MANGQEVKMVFKQAVGNLFQQFVQQNPQTSFAVNGLWHALDQLMQHYKVSDVPYEGTQEVLNGNV